MPDGLEEGAQAATVSTSWQAAGTLGAGPQGYQQPDNYQTTQPIAACHSMATAGLELFTGPPPPDQLPRCHLTCHCLTCRTLPQDGYGRPLTHSGSDQDRALTASLDSTLVQPNAYVRASLDQGLPVGGPWLSFSKGTVRAEALRALPAGLAAWASIRGRLRGKKLERAGPATMGGCMAHYALADG